MPMKIISTPSPTMRARSTVVPMSDLDRHDTANDEVANEDHENADRYQHPAHEVLEHRLEVAGGHEVHEHGKDDGQERDDRARRARLGGQRLDLTFEADPFSNRVSDVVEDLGEVATDRAVDRVRRGHEVEVLARGAARAGGPCGGLP